jgi:hypothetical protein
MAKKKVYRFLTIARAEKKEQSLPVLRSQSLPWQRCSLGAQVAPQRCPILRSSATILPCWLIFAIGWFFDVKMVGLLKLISNMHSAEVDGFS